MSAPIDGARRNALPQPVEGGASPLAPSSRIPIDSISSVDGSSQRQRLWGRCSSLLATGVAWLSYWISRLFSRQPTSPEFQDLDEELPLDEGLGSSKSSEENDVVVVTPRPTEDPVPVPPKSTWRWYNPLSWWK